MSEPREEPGAVLSEEEVKRIDDELIWRSCDSECEGRCQECPADTFRKLTASHESLRLALAQARAELRDHKEVLEDKRRMTREIAKVIDGDLAAKQPALVDVLAMVKELKARADAAEAALLTLREESDSLKAALKEMRSRFYFAPTETEPSQ